MFSGANIEYIVTLCINHLHDAVFKGILVLTLGNVYLCCQTTEEDLNLDSEPTIEDTVEEVIMHALLQPDDLQGKVVGGWKIGI